MVLIWGGWPRSRRPFETAMRMTPILRIWGPGTETGPMSTACNYPLEAHNGSRRISCLISSVRYFPGPHPSCPPPLPPLPSISPITVQHVFLTIFKSTRCTIWSLWEGAKKPAFEPVFEGKSAQKAAFNADLAHLFRALSISVRARTGGRGSHAGR